MRIDIKKNNAPLFKSGLNNNIPKRGKHKYKYSPTVLNEINYIKNKIGVGNVIF